MADSRFIVFEGLDGSGTSTQAQLLQESLVSSGRKAVVTSEPSPGPVGALIRLAMKRRLLFSEQSDVFDRQMAYLFAADRHDHLHNEVEGILALIHRGYWVISTRYFFSSFAYHSKTDPDWVFVRDLNKRFPNPDFLIYLDNPVDVSLRRIKHRVIADAYENECKLELVSANYKKLLLEYPGPLLVCDGTQPASEIHKQIVRELSEVFGFGKG